MMRTLRILDHRRGSSATSTCSMSTVGAAMASTLVDGVSFDMESRRWG